MNTMRTILASAALLAAALPAIAQQKPPLRGAPDAMTVVGGATQPALPSGHPSIPTDGGALPAGHPAMPPGGAVDPSKMGHSGAMAGATAGAIKVNVTQGTLDGPRLDKDPVIIQLFAKGTPIKTIRTALDDKGSIELHDLSLDVAFQPVITVQHAGADQQFVGPAVHKMQPMVEMDMKVYETTGARPEWTLGLCDIDVDIVDAGGKPALHFTELLGGFCPGDKAWTGDVVGGQLRTMTLKLPQDAMEIQMGPGFAESGATVVDHTLVRGKTMLPGSTQYVLGYTITAVDGKVTAAFTAPADTTLFALYMPEGLKVENLQGLELAKAGGTNATANRQLLKAKNLKTGQTVSAVLSNIKMPVAATRPQPLPQTSDLHLPVPTTSPGRGN